jgi:pyrroline-5-carboxylate reductase
MSKSLALCGVGRMGRAMLNGWCQSDSGIKFTLIEPHANEDLINFAKLSGLKLNPEVIDESFDIVVLAIKPQMFLEAIKGEFAKAIGENTLVVSVMAGISLNGLAQNTKAKRLCRTMPNTPGQIGQGISAYIGNENFTGEDKIIVERLLSPLGDVVALDDESQIDAVTAVSGSGPAYIFNLAEAMTSAAISVGLPPSLAAKLAQKTIIGSSALMANSDKDPATLRKEVTSPNGTTQAALEVLMGENGLEELMTKAIKAAHARSIELGKN